MTDRAERIAAFLKTSGWGAAERVALAGDASFRRYERLRLDGRSAVLMDAPPPNESAGPFLRVDAWLRAAGYGAPVVLAADAAHGLALLEDLGDDLVARVVDQNGDVAPAYAGAVDLLLDLHRHPPPADWPVFDDVERLAKAELLLDWYVPAVTGRPVSDEGRRAFRSAWAEMLPHVHVGAPVVVHRDFFADNLLWLPGRGGLARLGLLDFQDASVGPCAYDLAALVEDARRTLPAELRATLLDRYLAGRSDLDRGAFGRAFAVLAAQRHCRVLGVFTRLRVRDGKPGYLRHIPRLWRYLEARRGEAVLDPLTAWFDRYLPAARRVIPATD